MDKSNAEFWWNWIVQLGIALGTISAAVVGVFGERIRARFFPPALQVKLSSTTGVVVKRTRLMLSDGRPYETTSRWFHVEVSNLRRWSPARDALLYLTSIEMPDVAGAPYTAWQGSVPLKVRNVGPVLSGSTIGPPVTFDLLTLYKRIASDGPCMLELQPAISLTPMTHEFFETTKFVLTLQAKSLEVDSAPLKINVAWDGSWSDDEQEMTRHLVISAR